MATQLSSSTSSTYRRTARRDRRIRHRARFPKPNPPQLKTSRRRGPKRRKLREQDSLDLDNCYYACEDRGYHLDPDVRVGLEINHDETPYWFSDDSITDRSIAAEEPCPLLDFSAVGALARPSPTISSETGGGKVIFKRKGTRSLSEADLTENPSPPLPPILMTAKARTSIQLPSCHLEPSRNRCPPEYHSDYLNDVRIPSPLLYHSSQFEYTTPSDNPWLTWNVPSFEFAHGQQKPEPDFTSYRPVVCGAALDERTHMQRNESLGFAVCTAASSRHKAEASHVSDGSHDSSTHGDVLSSGDDLDSQELTRTNQEYSLVADVDRNGLVTPMGLDFPWYHDFFMPKVSYSQEIAVPPDVAPSEDNLIFPTLPTPINLDHALIACCSVNNIVHPGGNQAARSWERAGRGLPSFRDPVDTTPSPSMSDAVEAAVRGACSASEPQTTRGSLDSRDDTITSDGPYPGAAIKVVIPPCMDLVPARLYRHQLIAWPLSTAAVEARNRRDSDVSAVLRMAEWLAGLNTLRPYVGGQLGLPLPKPPGNDAGLNSRRNMSTFNDTLSSVLSARVECHGEPAEDEADSGSPDEGYFTCSERYSEADLLEDTPTDEEWVDWEWDFQSDDVDERIGLFASEWEGATKADTM
ncbi:hypothetical protein Z517_04274 [Fonsecaea pedrosoi CBS 271.37]|uniref:Uncharacterized protein n=1 Tax=Fonsecaea pedrosoi CBS 271.37 TaxID=1442368 RepID=A0A0D2H9H9_9EURO|nr:uncharacterized protein Z517_04274 [Fonsecaea pedrosoi CBS 271.37]KIW81249.1 hypothetical protein Z517_04274 [Fonsecaea pedrosoi CBS 271.37]